MTAPKPSKAQLALLRELAVEGNQIRYGRSGHLLIRSNGMASRCNAATVGGLYGLGLLAHVKPECNFSVITPAGRAALQGDA